MKKSPLPALALRPLLAASVALALSSCSLLQPSKPAPAPGTTEIQLVALNDFHGNLEPSKYTWDSAAGGGERVIQAGGIDTIGAALQAWRQQDPELLLVGAGDLIGASPAISAMWADEPTIGAMNQLGLRVTSVGNHEFDQGRIELLRQQEGGCKSPREDKACKFDGPYQGAQFQYLAANVVDLKTRKPLLPAYKIETSHGVKIAFIGAVLKETAESALASGIAGLQFVDEADAINSQLPELRKQGVGVFVVLIHQGGTTTDKFDQQDCQHLKGPIVDVVKRLDPAIRLVISGHSHQGYLCKVDGRLVTQSDMGGHVLGRIKMTVDTNANTVRDVSARQEVMVPGTWPADAALKTYLDKARQRSTSALAQPVATIAVPSVKRQKDHTRESALGDLVADSMLNAGRPFGVQIALQNPGGIRQDLETAAGNRVTLGHAMAVLPFGNGLVVMNLRGAQIVQLLEEQWLDGRDSKRGLLQVSEGFSYEWDASKPEGSRVVPYSVKLNGVPLEMDSSYRVITNNFLAEGGDGFPTFTKGGSRAPTNIRDIDAFTQYLAKRDLDQKPAGAAEPQVRYKEK